MKGFRAALGDAISCSEEYKNDVYRFSEDAGLGRKTIYNILRDTRLDESKTGPGIFGMARAAALLNTTLDALTTERKLPKVETATKSIKPLATHTLETLISQVEADENRLSVDALLRTYAKSGGRIEAFVPWLDRCDQYHPPNARSKRLECKEVGQQSLAAITMRCADKDVLQEAVDTLEDRELADKWRRDYAKASKLGTLTTIENLSIQMPNQPVKVRMEFLRCLLHVEDAEGTKTILNFSLLIV
ncbi:hypothetical protein [Shimia sagamensis]|uniref:HTH cro/C1-type domain-containing protein n=1 Tax=Shimia sagamensis TaxID=1566352 RepID=A0ABY1PDH7_9RHOB|nr:hypothetical protein [Shimia sagamensis]SMP32030.1 hypothetical protein SAMN06265373_108119 [Shimia sagamensis]